MTIYIRDRQKKVKVDRPRLRRVLSKMMESTGCSEKEISLLLVDNEGIREINRSFLDRDYPTNVISFSLAEGEYGNINPQLLGDIVVSVEKALAEAQEGGIEFDDALDFLLIHGLLHLLGYNHEAPDTDEVEKEKMRRKEEELFSSLKGYSLTSA